MPPHNPVSQATQDGETRCKGFGLSNIPSAPRVKKTPKQSSNSQRALAPSCRPALRARCLHFRPSCVCKIEINAGGQGSSGQGKNMAPGTRGKSPTSSGQLLSKLSWRIEKFRAVEKQTGRHHDPMAMLLESAGVSSKLSCLSTSENV